VIRMCYIADLGEEARIVAGQVRKRALKMCPGQQRVHCYGLDVFFPPGPMCWRLASQRGGRWCGTFKRRSLGGRP
jgi:hypothetical protein